MDRNKIIIIALLAVIVALLVGIFAMMPNETKKDVKLEFKSNATLTQGDAIKIRLTDANGTAIAGQKVNVTVTDENKSSDYHSVVTNSKGVGTLKLDKGAGKYVVSITYGGNDNYTGSNATQNITVEEAVTEMASSNSGSSSQSAEREEYQITPDGWNPGEHEVSRESIGNGNERVRYDDGYMRVVDSNGNVISHGWA